jgi:hypothetical protein
MAKAKAKKVHPDQEPLPGAEPGEKNERVHRAAKAYQKERDARIAANRKEAEAHEHLLDCMLDEGLDSYEYGGIQVFVDNKRKCRVVNPTAGDNGDASDED